MKNLTKYFFLLLAAFTLAVQLPAQNNYRRVDWLHGFGGFDNTKWAGYATRFGGPSGDRQMTSTITSYQVTGSIDNITDGISIPSNPTNIGIGHSLGGVVCRNFEATGGNEFGGVITVHSPNKGASIATAVNNGAAADFLTHVATTIVGAVDAVNFAMAPEISIINFLIGGLNGIINGINSIFSDIFGVFGSAFGSVIPNINEVGPSAEDIENQITGAFDMINNPDVQTVIDDLDPTNNFISNLNNSNAVPRIEVHGFETNHELLRLGCSNQSKVWLSPLALTTSLPDKCLVDELNDLNNSLGWANAYIITKASINTLSIIRLRRAAKLWKAAGDVHDARHLLDGGLEAGWNDLLGTQWETVTTTHTEFSQQCQAQINQYSSAINGLMQQYWQCQNSGGSNCNSYLGTANTIQYQLNQLQSDPGCWVTVTTTNYVPTDNSNAKNDGFILESEMTTGASNVLGTYQNVGVNHIEVLNHPETWKNFNLIFDSPTFFNTPLR